MGKVISATDALQFAKEASDIRGGKIDPKALLTVRRDEDKEDTLWNVFNRVQENLIRGGVEGVSPNGRRTRTLGIKAMGSTVKTNLKLWDLAENYL